MPPLVHRIERAFPAGLPPQQLTRYPGNDHEATVFFNARRWPDISASELRENSDAIGYFTAEALAYFAPAYMSAYLKAAPALDMAVESFLLNLGAARDTESPELVRASRVKSLFSEEQRGIVEEFVRHYVQVEGSCSLGIAEPAMSVYGINAPGGF